MYQKFKALFTVLVAMAFLTSATPIFASSANQKDDSKKTTTSKSKKSSKKKESKAKKSKKNDKKKKAPKASSKTPFKGKVNINKASKEDLMKLPGIGEVKAGEIIKARKHGKFKTAEDLMKVSGVGEKTVKGMAKHLAF